MEIEHWELGAMSKDEHLNIVRCLRRAKQRRFKVSLMHEIRYSTGEVRFMFGYEELSQIKFLPQVLELNFCISSYKS